jgi:hypothetical protein
VRDCDICRCIRVPNIYPAFAIPSLDFLVNGLILLVCVRFRNSASDEDATPVYWLP